MNPGLPDLLTAERADSVPILVRADGPRGWGWFRDRALNLAGQLSASPGRRCLLAIEAADAMAVAFVAAARAGCDILLPANLTPGHLATLAASADSVLTDQPDLPGLDPLSPPPGTAAPLSAAPLDVMAVTVIMHTSGSTGEPVAVARPLATLAAEVATLETTFAPGPGAVLGSVPPYHIYGLLFRVLWPLAMGRLIVGALLRYPNEVEREIGIHPGAIFVSSPAFLKRAFPTIDADRLAPHLSAVFSSGGPLDPAVAAAWNIVGGAPLREVFGSTETGGIAHRQVMDAATPPPWTPFATVTVLRDAETGRLRLRSPHQAGAGEMLCADRIDDILPDGRFTLLGRADRIVKIEERRVSLDEVERRLSALAEVREVRVLPLSRAGRTALCAVIVPTGQGWDALAANGRRALVLRLTGSLSEHLAEAALPRRWRFVRALPENSQGKATSADLAALFAPSVGRVTEPERTDAEQDGDNLRLTLRAQPALAYFDGHFDSAPILPGVAQIDWAVREARARFGIDQPFLRLEAVKFFRVIPVGTELKLDLIRRQEHGKVMFELTSAVGRHSSGRIVFGTEGTPTP